MTNLAAARISCTIFFLCAATVLASPAQTVTTLVKFSFYNDGAYPSDVTLVQGHNGHLYGTTGAGGNAYDHCGTVFEVDARAELTTLYDFSAYCSPEAGLVLGTDGNFYGTTATGTIFKITPSGVEMPIYTSSPQLYSALIQATDGYFYGTTGGDEEGPSTIFKVTASGVLTTLYTLGFTDGLNPVAAPVQATDGNLYGTTSNGGDPVCNLYEGCGTVYKITLAGNFTLLHTFEFTDGSYPSGLVQGSDGNLYGTTVGGGGSDKGTVFRIDRRGTLTTLHSFDLFDGAYPFGTPIQATDGNLYGTTEAGGDLTCTLIGGPGPGCGTIFQITPDGIFTSLHSFEGTDGSIPVGGLTQATNGTLYGTTEYGSGPESYGTIYSLDMNLGAFVTFVRAAGKVGETGPILGQGFTGTTGVAINGIQADFTLISDTEIRATVPAGATTGYVTVTTPSGTLTSNVPFHVIQ